MLALSVGWIKNYQEFRYIGCYSYNSKINNDAWNIILHYVYIKHEIILLRLCYNTFYPRYTYREKNFKFYFYYCIDQSQNLGMNNDEEWRPRRRGSQL